MPFDVEAFPDGPVDDYETVRATLRTGDLMFCAGTRFGSRLIRAATNSCWSHVAMIACLSDIDRVMVLESVESKGVRAIPLSKYVVGGYDGDAPYPGGVAIGRHSAFPEMADDMPRRQFGQAAVDQFGRPYDVAEIARIAARIAGSLFGGPETPHLLVRDKDYICSEYVYECYQSVGIDVPHNAAGFISPADFARDPNVDRVAVLRAAS